MAWLAIDSFGMEFVFSNEPVRCSDFWHCSMFGDTCIQLPKGSIKKLIGRELTWEDEPVELKEEQQ